MYSVSTAPSGRGQFVFREYGVGRGAVEGGNKVLMGRSWVCSDLKEWGSPVILTPSRGFVLGSCGAGIKVRFRWVEEIKVFPRQVFS